MMKNMGKGGQA